MGFFIDPAMVGKLLLASLFGAVIGLEREVHGRPAGFRTHLLVSLGSCLFTIISIELYHIYGNFSGTIPVGVDPGRIAAQVVTGIGFLGAGAIVREKNSIRGLTTAACLWVAAAIGLACGVGAFAAAFVVTALAFFSLLLLKKVENGLRRDTYIFVKVWSANLGMEREKVEQVMASCQLEVMHVAVEKNLEDRTTFLDFEAKYTTRRLACDLIDRIAAIEGIRKVRIH